MAKRLADWLEKASVGAFVVGLFQGRVLGVVVAVCFFVSCMLLTRRMEVKR